jgi:hypothetical protein
MPVAVILAWLLSSLSPLCPLSSFFSSFFDFPVLEMKKLSRYVCFLRWNTDNCRDLSFLYLLLSYSLLLCVCYFRFMLCFSLVFLLCLGSPPLLLWFSAPFIETQLLASNHSCLYRTVIFPDEIVGERRGPRSDLLQIISSPAESGAPLLKRDGEDARLLATVPFRQQMGIFNLTPASGNLTIWSQQSFNFTLGLISIKSLNLFN